MVLMVSVFSGYIRLVLLLSSLLVFETPKVFLSLYVVSVILDGKSTPASIRHSFLIFPLNTKQSLWHP